MKCVVRENKDYDSFLYVFSIMFGLDCSCFVNLGNEKKKDLFCNSCTNYGEHVYNGVGEKIIAV